MSTPTTFEVPVAHIDDAESIAKLTTNLRQLHGSEFDFAVCSWNGATRLSAPKDKTVYRFVMRSQNAKIQVQAGDWVRGLRGSNELLSQSAQNQQEELWPGDALVTNEQIGDIEIDGSGVYYEITTATTEYHAPKAAFLRNLPDAPGGCAAYENAFRREVIPPEKPPEHTNDGMGTNRVNEHTLDMRPDREPLPSKHHHGQVQTYTGMINHTETALVLPRSAYGLPLPNGTEEGHAILYRDPLTKGTTDSFEIPVSPGSIVVTPSTSDCLYGHSFANAFAMLVAVPGFVAPYVMINE